MDVVLLVAIRALAAATWPGLYDEYIKPLLDAGVSRRTISKIAARLGDERLLNDVYIM